VVITVVTVGVMQVAIDQVVDVVAMGYSFMSTVRSVNVSRLMAATLVVRCAALRVLCADVDAVFVNVVTVGMMQMAIM